MSISPSAPVRAARRRSGGSLPVLLLLGLGPAGCDLFTGPEEDTGLPGTLVVERPGYAAWAWLPGDGEILYSTPFDWPYTGPPTRLRAVAVPGGGPRTVAAAPTNGDRMIGYRFVVQGEHVYYEQSFAPDRVALYRAPLTGDTVGEQVLDSIPYGVSVSPDERLVAWVDVHTLPRELVTVEPETGTTRRYPLSDHGDRVHWSPDGGAVVVEIGGGWTAAGTPFHWIDLETGTTRLWLAPGDELVPEATRHFRWEGGETPYLYTTGDGYVARWSLDTGAREVLAMAGGEAVGWTADFEVVFLAHNECLDWSSGPFGGDCIHWRSRVDRFVWRTRETTTLLRHEGPGPIFGLLSPGGAWLAYEYSSCGGGCYTDGDGVYVVAVP